MSHGLNLNLQSADRDFLVALFHEQVPEAQVWAYGSRISGRGHAGSDLDLVLRARTGPIPGPTLAALREKISNSNLPIGVDLHDWAALPTAFQSEIEKHHLVLA